MVKIFASAIATAALLQSTLAHMLVVSPPPRSGVVSDELLKPCGGGNTFVARNATTFSVDAPGEFVLRPGHGKGNLIFSYFTEQTITNDTKATFLQSVDVPEPKTYNTTLDFAKAGLKNGQDIVVQAIYNGTDDGVTEEYYVCFDVKLADVSSASESASASKSDDSKSDSKDESKTSSDDKDEDKDKSSSTSGALTSTISAKAVLGAAVGVLAAAFAF
ncbi:hypothetical protein GGI07_000327 [Coemansia sp. Benny D115]|nr:hypothetical protein GGI07_000327 [Coemansia sp. Benny D115]